MDQRWGHDKAEDMAYALKNGAGVSPVSRHSFDQKVAINDFHREQNPSVDRQEQNQKLEEWSNEVLEPLSKIYDRNPGRFAAMPTKEFMDLASKVISLETRERAATSKLEALERDVATRKAALQDMRTELQGLLNPDLRPATVAETQG